MEILQNIFFFLFGLVMAGYFYRGSKINKLKEKNEKLSDEISRGMSDEVRSEMDNLKKENQDKTNIIDNLKKYLGIVGNKEYGIIRTTLIKTVNGVDDEDVRFTCGFKVTQRGTNKVRIHVIPDDIKCHPSSAFDITNESTVKRVQEIVGGWYDIDSDKITWIEPDEAIKRDIKLDSILSNEHLKSDE